MESCVVVLHKKIVHILVMLLVVFLHADQTLKKETGGRKDEEVISMMIQGRQAGKQTDGCTGARADGPLSKPGI